MERGPVIVVHGGAWAIPDGSTERSLIGVRNAAAAGWKRLQDGQSSAIDAVEAAVVELENDPIFDAGTGSVLTADGTVEMDAIIMNGADLSYGSVASVENIKNPVKLARLVMEKTEHTMLVGAGANRFAAEQGICKVSAETLVTAEAKADFERFKTYGISVMTNFSTRSDNLGHDTVGCVAFDGSNFAAATSTGGIMGKRPGRVGDSPLVGCGAYADNFAGAVSTTGHGESISKVCLARRIVEGCERGNLVAFDISFSYDNPALLL